MRWLPVIVGSAVAVGCGFGVLWRPPPAAAVAVAVFGLACATAGLARNRPPVIVAAVLGGLVAAAAALASSAEREVRGAPLEALISPGGGPVQLEGRLVRDAQPSGHGVRLSVRHQGWLVSLTVGGSLAHGMLPGWRAGRMVRAPASVRRPARYLNAGVPNHRRGLARRNLALVGSVKSGALVAVVDSGTWWSERAAELRAYCRGALEAHVGTGEEGAVARAILLGDRAGLDTETVDRLQEAGTYHVMAISGGNIAILAGLLLVCMRLTRAPPNVASAATIVMLTGYAGLVGAEPSVVRATVMAVSYLALRIVDLRTAPINALGTATAAMLLASPLSLTEPGFVLTVGATAALILLARRLIPRRLEGPAWRVVVGSIAASLATEVVLLPFGALLFNRITVAGLVLNLIAVPMMTVVQVGSLVVVALDRVVPILAGAAGGVVRLAGTGLIGSAGLVDLLPWLARRVPPPAPWAIVIYLGAVAGVFGASRLRTSGRLRLHVRRGALTLAALVGSWIVLHPWTWAWRPASDLRVSFLDVGQGDATLVELPSGRRILVDAGGLPGAGVFDVGIRVVAPALWARGVGRIETFVLTHGDPDHIGGMPGLIDSFAPTAVWEGVRVPAHEPLRRLRGRASAAGVAWYEGYAGTVIARDTAVVRLVHPSPPDWERPRVRNDDSLVLDVRLGDVSIVLPGDIGADVEPAVAALIASAPIRVLKVPHHGSATSSSDPFLDALAPALAIVSCGRDNRYGHPAPEVLARYATRGVPVLRTDRDGAITVTTDGTVVEVSTYVGQRMSFRAKR